MFILIYDFFVLCNWKEFSIIMSNQIYSNTILFFNFRNTFYCNRSFNFIKSKITTRLFKCFETRSKFLDSGLGSNLLPRQYIKHLSSLFCMFIVAFLLLILSVNIMKHVVLKGLYLLLFM